MPYTHTYHAYTIASHSTLHTAFENRKKLAWGTPGRSVSAMTTFGRAVESRSGKQSGTTIHHTPFNTHQLIQTAKVLFEAARAAGVRSSGAASRQIRNYGQTTQWQDRIWAEVNSWNCQVQSPAFGFSIFSELKAVFGKSVVSKAVFGLRGPWEKPRKHGVDPG